jgi:hypothetical protein
MLLCWRAVLERFVREDWRAEFGDRVRRGRRTAGREDGDEEEVVVLV